MIVLDYVIRTLPTAEPGLRNAGASELHYDLFLGDITFKVHDVDMSASWGWIPILDFAVCLHRIAEGLESTGSDCFEFTESEHRIDFRLGAAAAVEIRSTYGEGLPARVSLEELRISTREFLRRVLDQLIAKYPALGDNETVCQLYPSPGGVT